MLTILLGVIILAATAVAFMFARPVGGKVRPWITPRIEAVVGIAFVMAIGAGILTIVVGLSSALQ
jgi:hypothetical protein